MKSERDRLDVNAVEYNGDIVPWTDADPEIGAEWIEPISEDAPVSVLGDRALKSMIPPEFVLDADKLETAGVHRDVPEWQRDRYTYMHLGLDSFTNEDFRTLPAHEYDSWQRVIRNYVNSLKSHAGRIRHAEGQVEFDYELVRLYGNGCNSDELLRYADSLDRTVEAIEKRELIDHSRDDVFTVRKLKKAPHYETVHVIRDNEKLHLHIAPAEKQTA